MYKVIAFDLDGTLTESKQKIDDKTARFLAKIALDYEVAIITGGTMKQIETQVLENLPDGIENKLHLMSCSGAIYEKFGVLQYKYEIPKIQREVISSVIKVTAESLGLWEEKTLGDVIEDREAQITFSALGQRARLADKKAWDDTGNKRKSLVNALKKVFPDYSIRSGGLSSVDISQEGIDKEFALKQLMKLNNINASEILYIGDKFRPGENDYPALVAGVTCLRVLKPEDTIELTEKMLKQPHLRYIW